jgi:hypothetical protein
MGYKVNSDGIVEIVRELIVDILHEHAGLPNARVADEEQFEEVVTSVNVRRYYSAD